MTLGLQHQDHSENVKNAWYLPIILSTPKTTRDLICWSYSFTVSIAPSNSSRKSPLWKLGLAFLNELAQQQPSGLEMVSGFGYSSRVIQDSLRSTWHTDSMTRWDSGRLPFLSPKSVAHSPPCWSSIQWGQGWLFGLSKANLESRDWAVKFSWLGTMPERETGTTESMNE